MSFMGEPSSVASAVKRRIDQQAIPAALNAVAPIEALMWRLSDRARIRPAAALVMAACLGFGLARAWQARGLYRPRRVSR